MDTLRDLVEKDPSRPAIVVDGVSETFRLDTEAPPTLKERVVRLGRRSRSTARDFHALRDVSFEVAHGEAIGIIGHNGSGKSTLLKLLARILPPSEGTVDVNGRVASLLELGAGMHPDLSGRDNIALNAAILGLSREEIEARFDDIVDFAGVRDFLDTPVRNYSSGMYVRLGFSIATSVEPDILLVDEVLTVGDADFQRRSLKRMRSFTERGKTVVIVSHDLGTLEKLVDRLLVLERGRLIHDGSPSDGIELHQRRMGELTETGGDADAATPLLSRAVVVRSAVLVDASGRAVAAVKPSTRVQLVVDIEARSAVEACSVGVMVTSGSGQQLFETHTTWRGLGVGPLAAGQEATVRIDLDLALLAGHYDLTPVVTDPKARVRHHVAPALRLRVDPAIGRMGTVDLGGRASVTAGPALDMDAFRDEVEAGLMDEPDESAS